MWSFQYHCFANEAHAYNRMVATQSWRVTLKNGYGRHYLILFVASPNPNADKNSVTVEFDDGDSGRIPIDHIRMLPQDYPLVSK